MAALKITADEFISLSKTFPVFDVRSPGEYIHAHFPQAHSLPLFSNEERAIIGTAYKQESRQKAIKLGLDFFGVKMRKMVEEVEIIIGNQTHKTIILHCWRGGMRSSAVAWLLDMYGYRVYVLAGGYKAYRNWVLSQFEKTYLFNILGGYTGSGKTIVLDELKRIGHTVIDLEGLANHKGSAFGALGEKPQPGQEMFENLLANQLYYKSTVDDIAPGTNREIWLEDESQRIGLVMIPHTIWNSMRASPVYFLDIDFEERLKYLVSTYGIFPRESLVNSIMRIQKRLGGLETKNAINHLLENNYAESFRILLQYYDKLYAKGLLNRKNVDQILHKIACKSVDSKTNSITLQSIIKKVPLFEA
jgi:tRNA 2-selenouridine synthase